MIEGKSRVLSVVGAGGFEVVYRGVHEGFDAPVAVKCPKLPADPDAGAQDDLVRRLRDEVRLLLGVLWRLGGSKSGGAEQDDR
jgi:eukaryotic-like serine/threonine-protein kinase